MMPGKRTVLLATAAFAVLAWFWGSSRYPALHGKAQLDGNAMMSGELTESPVYFVTPAMGRFERTWKSTANWVSANKTGMKYGLILGALFMTLIGTLSLPRFKTPWANAAIGALFGAPLGLCVNCSAPVAHAFLRAGVPPAGAYAMMLSSPTFNIVVVTMLFSFFPPHLVLIKFFLAGVLILLVVPGLAKRFEVPASSPGFAPDTLAAGSGAPEESWPAAAGQAGLAFGKNLAYLIVVTVPLMFVAGALGVILSQAVDPATFFGGEVSLAGMAAAAAFGVFLPIPIAVDVLFAQALFQSGVPTPYVMVFLFTLGIYSVYPMLLIWRRVSRAWAFSLFAACAALGVLGGYLSIAGDAAWSRYDRWRTLRVLEAELRDAPEAAAAPAQGPAAADRPAAASRPVETFSAGGVAVKAYALAPRGADRGSFRAIAASELGLILDEGAGAGEFWPPLYYGRGIAAADFDGDGRVDLAFAGSGPPALFRNVGGRFERAALGHGEEAADASLVAFFDADADGDLDLFTAGYARGAKVFLNGGSGFGAAGLPLALPGGEHAMAAAFGDLDGDGRVDVVLGRETYGVFGVPRGLPDTSKNLVVLNRPAGFSAAALDEIPGETLSVLLTDLDADGNLDLVAGNHLDYPDRVAFGDGRGTLRPGAMPWPGTPVATMSVERADFDNDGRQEMLIAGSLRPPRELWSGRHDESAAGYCAAVGAADPARCGVLVRLRAELLKRGPRRADLRACAAASPGEKRGCLASGLFLIAVRTADASLCARIPGDAPLRRRCEEFTAPPLPRIPVDRAAIPQRPGNALLALAPDGTWTDETVRMGVRLSGWSWNSRPADLDNDGWLDFYVGNGYLRTGELRQSNHFFRNLQGRRFERAEDAFGLHDEALTPAFAVFDLDGDGDLDLVTRPVLGAPRVFLNETGPEPGLVIELRDRVGNRFGLGARVTLTASGRRQVREIRAGGGFHSFDPPLAHFGLGGDAGADGVEVVWPDGTRTALTRPLPGGRRYVIERGG